MKFSHKLIATISLSVLITFIILDISLLIVYKVVLSKQINTDGYDSNAFNQFSAVQIVSSTENYLETGFDIYEQVIVQIYQIYAKFKDQDNLYINQEDKDSLQLTQNFQKPRYDRSGLYFFNNQSTFYDEPYMDSAIACAILEQYPIYVKRVNLFYQNVDEQQDIMVRTVPATKDFIIYSSSAVTKRFVSSKPGNIVLTEWYYDQFSLSSNSSQLIAIRLYFPTLNNTNYRILCQIQINRQVINYALNQIYAYQTTAVAFIYLQNLANLQYQVLGASNKLTNYDSVINLQNYLNQGIYNLIDNSGDYLISTNAINNEEEIQELSNLEDDLFSNLRLILILNKTETNLANDFTSEFIQSQQGAMIQFLFVWSSIVVAIMVGIGFSISNYFFSYLEYIKRKCAEYLKNPQTAETSYFEMKEMAAKKSHNRILIENTIAIIQKIQAKKKMCQSIYDKNRSIKKNKTKTSSQQLDSYPLNSMDESFQTKMGLRDKQRLQKIGQLLQQKLKRKQGSYGKQQQ